MKENGMETYLIIAESLFVVYLSKFRELIQILSTIWEIAWKEW
jgi:hypothetical protein